MSEITRAYAVYKGQQYNASYNSGTQLWKVDIPSGAESSYGQNNHTYPIELHAFDAAGNETIMHATDGTYGDQLNIRVLEKTKPVAKIISPTRAVSLDQQRRTSNLSFLMPAAPVLIWHL